MVLIWNGFDLEWFWFGMVLIWNGFDLEQFDSRLLNFVLSQCSMVKMIWKYFGMFRLITIFIIKYKIYFTQQIAKTSIRQLSHIYIYDLRGLKNTNVKGT